MSLGDVVTGGVVVGGVTTGGVTIGSVVTGGMFVGGNTIGGSMETGGAIPGSAPLPPHAANRLTIKSVESIFLDFRFLKKELCISLFIIDFGGVNLMLGNTSRITLEKSMSTYFKVRRCNTL